MKDGNYSMHFSCDGYSGYGQLTLEGIVAKGGDDRYQIEGQITEVGRNLIGALMIDLAPGVSGNARIRGLFACAMTGTAAEDSFTLYGTGPLGIIIEILCQWAGTIEERMADRRRSEQLLRAIVEPAPKTA